MKIIEELFEQDNSVLNDLELYPKRYSAIRRLTSKFLEKNINTITYSDVEFFKNHITYLLHVEDLSPAQVKDKLGIVYTNFTAFISLCLKIPVKSVQQSVINFCKQSGRLVTDEKQCYWNACLFKFDPFTQPNIVGFELLSKHKFHVVSKLVTATCLNRDHMVSISYGWENKIDPTIISHPANCQVMFAKDNFKKNNSCSMTIDDLLKRIAIWDTATPLQLIESKRTSVLTRTRTEEHKRRIAATVSNHRIYTNGKINIKQDKSLPCPIGFRPGMIRKPNKKI